MRKDRYPKLRKYHPVDFFGNPTDDEEIDARIAARIKASEEENKSEE